MSKFTAALRAPYTPTDLWAERAAAMATFAACAGIVSLLMATISL